MIGALFILPFLLFSATAGQLTDKFEKNAHHPFREEPEIAIMLVAAAGFMAGSAAVLLAACSSWGCTPRCSGR
ncbi:phospholipid/glycerol acyltransferase [Alicycliphilus sp. B1]|nr:phospholipid/glycerol acyltransferase [Alicycliphilus sp. B1]